MVLPASRFPQAHIPETFGEMLKAQRIARGWSQARLAQEAGLKRETLSRLERNARKPVADTVFRLEAALDLEPSTLVPGWPEWAPVRSSSLGAGTRRRRRELKLSLATLSRLTGKSVATLSRFEREDRPTPTVVHVEQSELGHERSCLLSSELASALGFTYIAELERWCEFGGE